VKEPPGEDDCGEEHEADGLIADEGAALGEAAFVLGELFVVGLDAGVDHDGA
jgi:hypothetical protein